MRVMVGRWWWGCLLLVLGCGQPEPESVATVAAEDGGAGSVTASAGEAESGSLGGQVAVAAGLPQKFDEEFPPDRVPLRLGSVSLRAELALTPAVQERGLMFREGLPEDAGMLFVFPAPRRLSFWMRNTLIPLDIGYFDAEGVLREVYRMEPLDERGTSSRRSDLVMALEMNAGWFARKGIQPGYQLDMELLGEQLRRNGLEPEGLSWW